MLEFIALKLGKLCDDLVFLGGCTTGLFITDPIAPGSCAVGQVQVANRNPEDRLAQTRRQIAFSPRQCPAKRQIADRRDGDR